MADGGNEADDDPDVRYKHLIFEQFQCQIYVDPNHIHLICS